MRLTLSETLRRKLGRATEPQVLFPALAALLLAVIWVTTLGILRVKRVDAERAAAVATQNLLDTYEAQVVRALREIDHTLSLVRFWPGRRARRPILQSLRDEGLLPADLLFTVTIADRNGTIVESTRPSAVQSVAGQDYFEQQRAADRFFVGHLPPGATGDTKLPFSRRLDAADGSFDGIVSVAVDAAYFVSSYENALLGERGVLGVLGDDGVFRVRRTGTAVMSGEASGFKPAAAAPATDTAATVERARWDGVRRWTSTRELYGFPLAVLVGLSVDEQMAAAHQQSRVYVWWAFLASAFVLITTAVLGRLSWQLARSRLRESEARVAHAQQVEYLAYHDALTGLPNRSLFSKLLGKTITEAHRYGRRAAVAFLDLDRFKQINDTLGHEAGDQLLREVANRLRGCIRASDTVARLGGDEFVVLLAEVADEQDAMLVAQKILAATAKPFTLLGQEFRVTASVGISTYPRDGLDEETLKKSADIAMYHAKAEGKNNYQFYSERLNANSLERLALESSLRHALENREFRLYYQAKRDIASGEITGTEALLRWQHPDLGVVAPMRFIPVAEETGLIVPIGKWVLRTACAQFVAWRGAGLPVSSIAVNLTTRQFRDEHLLADLRAILGETGMDPRQLEVELHESLLIYDVDSTLRTLAQLKALGIRIAVDDFGTGYSSLAMLQQFPLDTVKIDRSITRDFIGALENSQLTHAIIAMGKSLSLTVVAQGVETREQVELLRRHACDELQGFYFKHPLPAEQFAQLLQEEADDLNYTASRRR